MNGQNRGNRFIPPILKWPAGCGTGLDLPPHHQNDRQKNLSISGMGLKIKKYKEYYTLSSLQTHKGNKNVRFSQKRVIFAEAPHIIIIGTALSRSLSERRDFRYTNNQGRNVIWPPERPKGKRKQTGEKKTLDGMTAKRLFLPVRFFIF